MSFIRDLIFWLLIKCWKIAVVLLVMFFAVLAYLACARYWQMAKDDFTSYEARIVHAVAEIAKEIDVRENARKKLVEIKEREPWFLNPWHIPWSFEYKYWNGVYQGADAAAKRATQTKEELQRGLSEAKTGKWWLVGIAERAWATSFSFLGLIVFAIVFVPGLWKAFWFYIVAPIASKAAPIQVGESTASHLIVSEPKSVQEVELIAGSAVCTRGEWVNPYPSEDVKKKTRLLWNWQAPLVSYASGLRELTEWRNTRETTQVLKLCSRDPNLNIVIVKVAFATEAALVVRPSSIVAISGDLKITTCWKLSSIHSWISGRLRHVIISGQGALYLSGYGNVTAETPQDKQRMSDNLLIAHDPTAPFRTVRTETFWPFLRSKTSLYDLQFEDQGLVIYQAAARGAADGKRPAHERLQGWIDLLLKPLGL